MHEYMGGFSPIKLINGDQIEKKFEFSYMKRFNDNGKLLNRYDLFSGKDTETLEKYANLKKQ